MKYYVREPLFAVVKDPGMPATYLVIEPGSMISIKGEELVTGFVEVLHGCQSVMVYMRDLEKKADRLQGKGN